MTRPVEDLARAAVRMRTEEGVRGGGRGGRHLRSRSLILIALATLSLASCREAPTQPDESDVRTQIGAGGGTARTTAGTGLIVGPGVLPDGSAVAVSEIDLEDLPEAKELLDAIAPLLSAVPTEGRALRVAITAAPDGPLELVLRPRTGVGMTPGDRLVALILVEQAGGQSVLEQFEPFDADFDASSGLASVLLPRWAGRSLDAGTEIIASLAVIQEEDGPEIEASRSTGPLRAISLDPADVATFANQGCVSGPFTWDPASPFLALTPPLANVFVTDKFGEIRRGVPRPKWEVHAGVDYRAPVGTPVFAMHDGSVTEGHQVNQQGRGWGTYAINTGRVDGRRIWTLYAHLSEVAKTGTVRAGDLIAYSGTSGTTAAHLHVEFLPALRRGSFNEQKSGKWDPHGCIVPFITSVERPESIAEAGFPLPAPVVIEVVRTVAFAEGPATTPAIDVAVSAIPSGDGRVTTGPHVTDENGRVAIDWSLGQTVGEQQLVISLGPTAADASGSGVLRSDTVRAEAEEPGLDVSGRWTASLVHTSTVVIDPLLPPPHSPPFTTADLEWTLAQQGLQVTGTIESGSFQGTVSGTLIENEIPGTSDFAGVMWLQGYPSPFDLTLAFYPDLGDLVGNDGGGSAVYSTPGLVHIYDLVLQRIDPPS